MARRFTALLAGLAILAFAAPTLAAPMASSQAIHADADHLGGSLLLCGRVLEYVAPVPGTTGAITVAGTADFESHAFPIDDALAADPTLAALAASDSWSCLDAVGDGMGVLTSVAIAAGPRPCGTLAMAGSSIGLLGELTTLVLDGEAGAVVAGDADLELLLGSIAGVGSSATACLDVTLDPFGVVSAVALDYELDGLTAPIACGPVGGTPLAYRDPASAPYPDDSTISVDGVTVDASLLAAPHLSVLAYHLDAGLEICLLGRVIDSIVVEAAVLTGATDVCGVLEVRGGLVNVDGVVVSQQLTGINFGAPLSATLESACMDARAQQGAASGTLTVCGALTEVTPSTYSVGGVTFYLEAPIDADASLDVGSTAAIRLEGPNPFLMFGAGNPAALTTGRLEDCTAPLLPDAAALPVSSGASGIALLLGLGALGGSFVAAARRSRASRAT